MIFKKDLERLEARLDVPYPARRRVLDEIADHLEALYDEARAEGLDQGAARGRALEALAADDEFLAEMGEVHRTAVARALDRLPRAVSLGIEAAGIGTLGLAMVVTVLTEEAQMIEFLSDGGIFMILINVAGLAMVLMAFERVWSLFVKRDHSEGNLRRRLFSIRFLGRACAVTGVLGTLMGFYQAFSAALSRDVELPLYLVIKIAISTSIAGLTYALLAMIAAYVMEAKVRRIEGMRLT